MVVLAVSVMVCVIVVVEMAVTVRVLLTLLVATSVSVVLGSGELCRPSMVGSLRPACLLAAGRILDVCSMMWPGMICRLARQPAMMLLVRLVNADARGGRVDGWQVAGQLRNHLGQGQEDAAMTGVIIAAGGACRCLRLHRRLKLSF